MDEMNDQITLVKSTETTEKMTVIGATQEREVFCRSRKQITDNEADDIGVFVLC